MATNTHILVGLLLLGCVGVHCKSARSFEIVFMNSSVDPNLDYLKITEAVKNAGTVEATLNMEYEVMQDYPLDLQFILRIERKVYGNYVTAGIPLQKSLCDYIKNDKSFYPSLLKYGENMPRSCPLKKGSIYKFVNFNLNQFDLPMSILPNGDYRVTIQTLFPGKPNTILLIARIQSAS